MPTSSRSRASLAWAVGIVAVYLVVGAAAGWLWESRFDPPSGVVIGHTWYPDPWDAGQRTVFGATGSYVVIALVAGLVLGTIATLTSQRRELVTLVAVLLGSAGAGLLMLWLGLHLAPPDPAQAAKTAADQTRLAGGLATPSRAAWVAFPLASLVVLCVIYLTVPPRQPDDVSDEG